MNKTLTTVTVLAIAACMLNANEPQKNDADLAARVKTLEEKMDLIAKLAQLMSNRIEKLGEADQQLLSVLGEADQQLASALDEVSGKAQRLAENDMLMGLRYNALLGSVIEEHPITYKKYHAFAEMILEDLSDPDTGVVSIEEVDSLIKRTGDEAWLNVWHNKVRPKAMRKLRDE